MARGELRIYLGAAPGVGKTYAMLDEGRRRAARGTAVVVGAIDTHERPATVAALDGLDVVSRHLDVDAVLARRPQVVLVDDLARHDATDDGTPPRPRHEAVERLLDAGIDVLTTVDIGQLESLGEVVTDITGVPAGPLVPDRVVRAADQIQLVDQTPEALARRLAHGNIFTAGEVDAELADAYRPARLAALRELTLSWMADRAEEGAAALGREPGRRWETREVVLVALTGAPTAEHVIRRAARLADRQRARLIGVHVRSLDDGRPAGANPGLEAQRRLLSSLGGEYRETAAGDVAEALVEVATAEHATQIVLGATRRSRWETLRRGSLVAEVIERSPVDVHVVRADPAAGRASDDDAVGDDAVARRPSPGTSLFTRRRRAWSWVMAIAAPTAITAVLGTFEASVGLPTQLLILVLGVTATAVAGGTAPAGLAAAVAFVAANWFFIPPVHELSISSTEDAVSLTAFAVVALTVGGYVSLSARRAAESLRASSNASTLAAMAGAVATSPDPLPALAERLRQAYGAAGAALFTRQDGSWALIASAGTDVPASEDQAAQTLPVGDGARLLLSGPDVRPVDRATTAAFLDQLAVAVEQRRLRAGREEAKAVAAENELRAALLAAVSHDLRTPLAAVKAAVSSLRQRGVEWPPEVRDELLVTIDEGADRLSGLIANLLDMTRLRAGAVEVSLGAVYLDEVVHRAVVGLPPRPARVEVDLDDRLPAVAGDGALLEHVVANLVDNATKWSPPDRPVVVDAAVIDDAVHLRVVDRGPGIPADARAAVRRPFQRADDGTLTPGTGHGLAVADGFTTLMGAQLHLDDTPGGGTTATLVLPVHHPDPSPEDPDA